MESKGSSSRPVRWIASGVALIVTLGIAGGLFYFYRLAPRHISGEKIGYVSVSGVNFSCRLPVIAGAGAAFISFPDGSVTLDHRLNLDGFKGGYYGYTYAARAGKWVQVSSSAISPDGRSYAYLAETTGVPGEMSSMSLHTHEIASGKDRLLWQGPGSPMGGPSSVTWIASGIYFSAVIFPASGPMGPYFPALYVADPNRPGTPQRVGPNPPPEPPTADKPYSSGPDMFMLVGGGAAWGTGQRTPKTAPQPNQPPDPGTFGPDRVLRMDLRDGSVSTWYTVSGNDLVSIMGLDAQGRPILSLFTAMKPVMKDGQPVKAYEPPPLRMYLLTGPNQTVEMSSGNPDFHLASQPSADSHGIWFGSWNSIWLYTQNGGLRQVASAPAGIFPSPSVPPGAYPAKGAPSSAARAQMPTWMQGTMITPAGACA